MERTSAMNTNPHQGRKRGRPRSQPTGRISGGAQALQRGLVLLSALARGDKVTLTELAFQVGMPLSTAHRLLTTLQAHGYADFDETTNHWMVGAEAFRTGNAFLRRIDVVEAARDIMHDLVAQTGETANLAIREGAAVVFVSQVESSSPVRAFFNLGTHTPMHASGIGKALLATYQQREVERLLQSAGLPDFTGHTLTTPEALFTDLESIRQRGWSLDDEERNVGMRCVAAPIFNELGEAVAGVSVSGPSSRLSDSVIGEYGPLVKRTAERITARIGGAKPADA